MQRAELQSKDQNGSGTADCGDFHERFFDTDWYWGGLWAHPNPKHERELIADYTDRKAPGGLARRGTEPTEEKWAGQAERMS